jgi:hypothetical protein
LSALGGYAPFSHHIIPAGTQWSAGIWLLSIGLGTSFIRAGAVCYFEPFCSLLLREKEAARPPKAEEAGGTLACGQGKSEGCKGKLDAFALLFRSGI